MQECVTTKIEIKYECASHMEWEFLQDAITPDRIVRCMLTVTFDYWLEVHCSSNFEN
ncbi:MAG: hypothetical protein ACI90V_011568 [Bacillariaceae sp.]|jgi:hypothetical protein